MYSSVLRRSRIGGARIQLTAQRRADLLQASYLSIAPDVFRAHTNGLRDLVFLERLRGSG